MCAVASIAALHEIGAWLPIWGTGLGARLQDALAWGARHTGLPIVLVAAIFLVISWHVFRRVMRFAWEVALALAALLLATRLGWISW